MAAYYLRDPSEPSLARFREDFNQLLAEVQQARNSGDNEWMNFQKKFQDAIREKNGEGFYRLLRHHLVAPLLRRKMFILQCRESELWEDFIQHVCVEILTKQDRFPEDPTFWNLWLRRTLHWSFDRFLRQFEKQHHIPWKMEEEEKTEPAHLDLDNQRRILHYALLHLPMSARILLRLKYGLDYVGAEPIPRLYKLWRRTRAAEGFVLVRSREYLQNLMQSPDGTYRLDLPLHSGYWQFSGPALLLQFGNFCGKQRALYLDQSTIQPLSVREAASSWLVLGYGVEPRRIGQHRAQHPSKPALPEGRMLLGARARPILAKARQIHSCRCNTPRQMTRIIGLPEVHVVAGVLETRPQVFCADCQQAVEYLQTELLAGLRQNT